MRLPQWRQRLHPSPPYPTTRQRSQRIQSETSQCQTSYQVASAFAAALHQLNGAGRGGSVGNLFFHRWVLCLDLEGIGLFEGVGRGRGDWVWELHCLVCLNFGLDLFRIYRSFRFGLVENCEVVLNGLNRGQFLSRGSTFTDIEVRSKLYTFCDALPYDSSRYEHFSLP